MAAKIAAGTTSKLVGTIEIDGRDGWHPRLIERESLISPAKWRSLGGGLDHRDVEALALAAVAGIGAQCAAVPALHAMRGPPIKSNQNGGVRAAERHCLPPLSRPPAGFSAVQPLHLSH